MATKMPGGKRPAPEGNLKRNKPYPNPSYEPNQHKSNYTKLNLKVYIYKYLPNPSYEPSYQILAFLKLILETNAHLAKYLPSNTYLSYLPAMDTSASNAPKKSLRATLTAQYEARVASTLEKVDPNRAKARSALKDIDMDVEALAGEWDGYKDPMPSTSQSYEEAPVLTLRELMPGSTGGDVEDRDLDLSFRADKIDFMVVHRPLSAEEKEVDMVLKDPADVDWSIPDQSEYEDIMGTALDIYTDEKPELVHALAWSSVGSTTGVGCFSVRTGRLSDLDDIRGTLRTIIVHGQCFESFPKKSLMKSYSLTAFFPRSTKCVGTKKLITWLLSCNRGLQGKIWPIEARKYPEDHPVARRRGARVLSFTGDQTFLDSLQRFPKDFPFNIRIANVYIRGGERTAEGKSTALRRRPRMTAESLKNLLRRHGKEIADEANAEEDAKDKANGKNPEGNRA